ncbi:hypothetical protein SNOG_14080 [Parastagonospora nodorum SN15]|uniref:Uncharacterized protein n=1 Tax=Phaeosphaeria nodorum (strain SN15 / ATCC MYA-4574 / FGSC 10173) TaxID=321614 RepID=Q0U2F3_PHANO|nr:hypothetical protein SNOG_14080 [Parastagonospora nodorum SN15]EAT78705.1 hypothetical protein SNOG_14080 [Parastagonospora nodorum SN15]
MTLAGKQPTNPAIIVANTKKSRILTMLFVNAWHSALHRADWHHVNDWHTCE